MMWGRKSRVEGIRLKGQVGVKVQESGFNVNSNSGDMEVGVDVVVCFQMMEGQGRSGVLWTGAKLRAKFEVSIYPHTSME